MTKVGPSPQLSWGKFLLLAGSVFCIFYNITFVGLEFLSLGRLAVVFLFFWVLYQKKNPFSRLRTRAWILFIPVPAVAMQFLLVPDFGQLSRFVYLAYFSFLGAAFVAMIAEDMGVILRAVLFAVSVQSVVLFFSFVSPTYRAWFDGAVLTGSNFDANYLYRAPGFSSEGGSSLSVIQSFGVFAGWLLLRENAFYACVRGRGVYLVYLGIALSLLSCIVVGRTGLLLSCIFLLFFLVTVGIRGRLVFFLAISSIIIYVVLSQFLGPLLDSSFSMDYFEQWAFGFFTGNDDTVATLARMPIPSLSSDTIFGTGLASIVDGNNPSGHDSGFIQAYFSMGLLLSSLLYALYMYVLFYVLRWLPLLERMLLALLIFGLEVKEPFLFKYSTMFLLMSLHFCFLNWKRAGRAAQLRLVA